MRNVIRCSELFATLNVVKFLINVTISYNDNYIYHLRPNKMSINHFIVEFKIKVAIITLKIVD